MPSPLLSSAVGLVVVMCCAHAHAQCMTNTECKGDRVCEDGGCVDAPLAAPQATSATEAPAAAPPASAPPATTPPRAAPANVPPRSPPLSTREQASPPRLVPHSEVMTGVGIFSVVLAGAGFIGAVGAMFSDFGCGFGNIGSLGSNCDNNGNNGHIAAGLLSAAVLTGVGVTLIVVGNRKVPAPPMKSTTVSPWVGRQSAGLSLRLDL